MALLEIIENNILIVCVLVTLIGFIQGGILARGIRKRFPRLKKHARSVSIFFLVLFIINAISSIVKFATPSKIISQDMTLPSTVDELMTVIVKILGLDAGLITAITIFITITLFLIFRFAEISVLQRYFLFTISVIVILLAFLGKFTSFVPNEFQIISYSFYQFGLAFGVYIISKRKMTDPFDEIK